MQRPWAALRLVLFIFVSNSFAEDKNDEITNNPILSEDIINIPNTGDVTQFIDQIIHKLNDDSLNKDREETFVFDSKVGNVKVENQQLGKGKYKIIINKKQIKNTPKKSVRTYKIKVKSKSRVQPKKITFETNSDSEADINSIISKFISKKEISKNINRNTDDNNHNFATSDNVKALRDSEQLRVILSKFVQSIQANSGSKIKDNANLDKLLSYLWTIVKSKADVSPTENHEKLAAIAVSNDTPKLISRQSNGHEGFDAVHGQHTSFHLPYQTTDQEEQKLKISDQSFKTDDIQALIDVLTYQGSNLNDLTTVESLTPQDNPKTSKKDRFESIKELVIGKSESEQVNPNLDDSHVQGLVSKLCDAAKNNIIEFWKLLLRHLRSNNSEDNIENETNEKSPFYEVIKEILKENNKDLNKHDQGESDLVDRSILKKIKKLEHKDKQFKYSTIEQTTTTDATVQIHSKPLLTSSESLARYGDLINNPTGNEIIALEKNNSFTVPHYDIELTTQSSIIKLYPKSDNNSLKYKEEDTNPDLLRVNENENNNLDELNIAHENNTVERNKLNWPFPSTDNLVNLFNHINDTEPHEHHVDEIHKEPHSFDHVDDDDKLLQLSYDVHKDDNTQHPSAHVNEDDNLQHPSDHFDDHANDTPSSNHVNEFKVNVNDIMSYMTDHLNENVKGSPPSNHDNANNTELLPPYVIKQVIVPPLSNHLNENVEEKSLLNNVNDNNTKPLLPYHVIEHGKLPNPSNNINESDKELYPSDNFNENFKETLPNPGNGNYKKVLTPYHVIEHDKLPYPTNDVNLNDMISYISDRFNENVKETPPSHHDNGIITELLPPYVIDHDILPHPSNHVSENDIVPPSNHDNRNYTKSLIPHYVTEYNKLPYPSNDVNENDKETLPSDLNNENNIDPLLINYIIEHTKLPPPSNHVNRHITHENDSEERDSGIEDTSEDKSQVVDHVALPDNFDYELDRISTESPEFSQEETFVNKYPLNHKTILQYINPHGNINNDGLKDDDEYMKYIYSLPEPLLQSLLLSIDQELNPDTDPSGPKVSPDTYLLLNKLLQLNLSPHIRNYNKNVHSVVNKHTYPDFYIILNKLKDLGKMKNKKSHNQMNINLLPDKHNLSEKIDHENKNKNTGKTLNYLIEYLTSSLPDDPSDCRVKSYNEVLEKIIHFFQTVNNNDE